MITSNNRYLVSNRDAFAIQNPTRAENKQIMLCLDFKYLWLTASSESTKIVEPVIAQLEVFTDEINEIPTGTIADKNVKVRSVNVFLFRLRAKIIKTDAIREFKRRI